VLEQGVADETVAAALGQQFVEADIQLAELLDVEVFHRARQQGLHGAAQKGPALRVGVELPAEQGFRLENEAEFQAFSRQGAQP
jgi:hypothetical protein